MNATTTEVKTRKVAYRVGAGGAQVDIPGLGEIVGDSRKYSTLGLSNKIAALKLPSLVEAAKGAKFLASGEVEMPEDEYQRMVDTILGEAELQRKNFAESPRERYEIMLKIAAHIGASQAMIDRNIAIPDFMREHEAVPIAAAPETEQAETRIVDGRIVEDHSWTAEKARAADAEREQEDDRPRHGGRTSGNPCDACGDASGETYWRGRRGWICGDCLDEGSSGYGYAW